MPDAPKLLALCIVLSLIGCGNYGTPPMGPDRYEVENVATHSIYVFVTIDGLEILLGELGPGESLTVSAEHLAIESIRVESIKEKRP